MSGRAASDLDQEAQHHAINAFSGQTQASSMSTGCNLPVGGAGLGIQDGY